MEIVNQAKATTVGVGILVEKASQDAEDKQVNILFIM